jgi:Asp-tRNA(Asn)/Glu-tRNA(Gln) amidotransferase A subunit family amidase
MPASYQGLFSLKPSGGRLSMRGVANMVGSSSQLQTFFLMVFNLQGTRAASHPYHHRHYGDICLDPKTSL